jgi:cyclophilin family peptidyl-prolyl cis-trans isomerase
MKIRRFALAALLTTIELFAVAQEPGARGPESRTPADVAARVERDRTEALLLLEYTRSADVAAWRKLLERADDPRFFGRVLRGLGRVGEPELEALLVEALDKPAGIWTRDAQRGAAIAVGLFGDPARLSKLAAKSTPRDVFFALGLMKKLPADGQAPVPAWTDAGAESQPVADPREATFADPVVAALRWGAAVPEPVFADLARKALAEGAPPDGRTAAVDYFARSKASAPADLKPVLTSLLSARAPELAGLAARALAKSEAAGDAEADAIDAAFVSGVDRVAQVDRIRALGALKTPAAHEALVRAIGLSRSDASVRRTVMEALKGIPWANVKPASRKSAATLVRAIALPKEDETPAPPDLRAAAVAALAAIDPAQFEAALPDLRLAPPWPVRAAAGVAVLAQPKLDAAWLRRFLADPDRRVRVAVLEAFAEKPVPNPEDELSPILEPFFERVSQSPMHYHVPRTWDPVEISVLAGAIRAGDRRRGGLFLAGLFKDVGFRSEQRLPDHEVEASQAVLDLAADVEGGESTLRWYLKSPEISLRKRAKNLLNKKGIDAKEEPEVDAYRDSQLRELSRAAASRLFENPAPAALIETSKGDVTIRLFAVDAPLTVENFMRLAKSGFYDGILWHRVVPAFVAQAGCPRGDGWGGPGYTIPCEVNDRTYQRGSVGMALAGKDTGGSQFFICHRALPHLDGRYTLFGQVTDGMDVVDKLTQDDVILKVREL